MTETPGPDNHAQPDDNINTRLDDLGDELDLIRTIQGGLRREPRFNSQPRPDGYGNIYKVGMGEPATRTSKGLENFPKN